MESTDVNVIKAARNPARRAFAADVAPTILTAGQMRASGGMNHATAERLAAAGQFPAPTHSAASAAFWDPTDPVVSGWLERCRRIHAEGGYLAHCLPSVPAWVRAGHAAAPTGWPTIPLVSQEELARLAKFDPGKAWSNLRDAGKVPKPSFVARRGYLYVLTDELQKWAEAAAATKGTSWRRVEAVAAFEKGDQG